MKKIKKKKHLSQEYPIDESPFTKNTEIKAKFNLQQLQNTDSDIVLARKRSFKSDEYTKLIVNEDLNLSDIYNLSKLANTVLFYILYNCLEYNTPTFRLELENFMILIKFKSKNKIYDAINELIHIGYIARTSTKEVYWINHNFFYKGNFLITKRLRLKDKESDEFGITNTLE